MMERLFAVQQQRDVFLLMTLGGVALGFVVDAARYARPALRRGVFLLDLLPGAGLLTLLVWALADGREAMRLYSLLGVALGGVLYAAGFAPVLAWLVSLWKKLCAAVRGGRKSAGPGECT